MNKNLIIRLIQQDLKHNQLLQGLENLGFTDCGNHSLGIMPIVFELMKLPEKERDIASIVYIEHLEQANNYPASGNGKELLKLAKECWRNLND